MYLHYLQLILVSNNYEPSSQIQTIMNHVAKFSSLFAVYFDYEKLVNILESIHNEWFVLCGNKILQPLNQSNSP